MPPLDEQKRALRAQVRARLPPPGTDAFVVASLAAQQRLARWIASRSERMIALYRALPSECGTSTLAEALREAGREICYPCVIEGERLLSFRREGSSYALSA